MSHMSDLIIGMLIGAVLVLSYLTIHFYLKCKDKGKAYGKLMTDYCNKIIEHNNLRAKYDCLQQRYREMRKEIEDVKQREIC